MMIYSENDQNCKNIMDGLASLMTRVAKKQLTFANAGQKGKYTNREGHQNIEGVSNNASSWYAKHDTYAVRQGGRRAKKTPVDSSRGLRRIIVKVTGSAEAPEVSKGPAYFTKDHYDAFQPLDANYVTAAWKRAQDLYMKVIQ